MMLPYEAVIPHHRIAAQARWVFKTDVLKTITTRGMYFTFDL